MHVDGALSMYEFDLACFGAEFIILRMLFCFMERVLYAKLWFMSHSDGR